MTDTAPMSRTHAIATFLGYAEMIEREWWPGRAIPETRDALTALGVTAAALT